MLVSIFAGGDQIPPDVVRRLPAADLCIAADSGARHAREAGVRVDHLVGDFDSIDPETATWAEERGAILHRHPADKDMTDLELALTLATEAGATELLVVGGHGGRLDHLAANLALIASARWPNPLTWMAGPDRVEVVRGRRSIAATPGAVVSVLAAEPATGVTMTGVRWKLTHESLAPGSTRGVSNIVRESPFHVDVETGTLLVIIPGQDS